MRRVFGIFVLLYWVTCVGADDWPQWRGPNRDNKVTGFEVPEGWPQKLTKQWKIPVGEGLSGPALVGDKLYVFTGQGNNEVIRCLDAASGKEVWKETYATRPVTGRAIGPEQAAVGPRSAPAVADGKVCTFGVGGILSCLDTNDGKVLWRHDTRAKPKFYTSASPLITDGLCVVHTGTDGSGALTAFDLGTGATKWKWSGDGPSYGSPVVMTVGDSKQVVVLTERYLVGVSLADGKLLWKVSFTQGRYQTATPVLDGATVILSGSAYRIEKKGDEFSATQVWKDRAPHQYSTPVLKDDVLYGFNASSRFIYCQDAKTGKVLWTNATTSGECGYILDVGPVLVALSSDSDLVVFKANKEAYKEVHRYKVADSPTWAEPILAGNRIYIKDKDSLTLWTIE
jgi:outer membrane protein assembly factor BamB